MGSNLCLYTARLLTVAGQLETFLLQTVSELQGKLAKIWKVQPNHPLVLQHMFVFFFSIVMFICNLTQIALKEFA